MSAQINIGVMRGIIVEFANKFAAGNKNTNKNILTIKYYSICYCNCGVVASWSNYSPLCCCVEVDVPVPHAT